MSVLRRDRRVRAVASPTVYAVCFATALTLVVWLVPRISIAYRSASLHVAFETASAVIAFLVVALLAGRPREIASRGDAMIAAALTTLALSSLVALVNAVVGGDRTLTGWWLLAGSCLGGLEFGAGSLLALRPTRDRVRTPPAIAIACAAYAVVILALWQLERLLPEWHAAVLSAGATPAVQIQGNADSLAVSSTSAASFALAAVCFARAAAGRPGSLARWLGPAAVLGAGSRVNYLLFPSRVSSWIYLGDLLRIGFYLVLLAAALAEIRDYQRSAAERAVLEERRLLARELHDGLAQELVYVVQQTRAAGSAPQLEAAAQRALDESRRVIAILTQPLGEPLAATLERAAAEVAQRCGVRLRFDARGDAATSPAVREALVRVVREAIDNSVRHGGAARVSVECERDGDLRLRVVDDGSGPGADDESRGFALRRLRAELAAHGGSLELRAGVDGGAVVEARVP